MRQENFPKSVSDPEAEGIPDYADDDSTAYDDVDTGREADGLNPAMMPRDQPVGMTKFGTTPEEARIGESLDLKLDREAPERDPGGIDRSLLDDGPVDPHLDSQVSMYDRPLGDEDAGSPVGRIVEPDEGAHEDVDKDMIGYDAGAAGGGASAEELAMHEVREP